MSAKFSPARSTRTSTSSGPGAGVGRSTTRSTSGPPNSSIWTARTRPRLYLAGAMPITVVGSIAFDAVKTPFAQSERMLGGAAVHFALAAGFFDEVHVVGP